jgi:hypothetical protein
MSQALTTAFMPGSSIIANGGQQNSVTVKAYSITNQSSGVTVTDYGATRSPP